MIAYHQLIVSVNILVFILIFVSSSVDATTRLEVQKDFLVNILKQEEVLIDGFASGAGWEVYLHVALNKSIREKFYGENGNVHHSIREKKIGDSFIDFMYMGQGATNCNMYAIEMKVETKRKLPLSHNDSRRFAGLTVKEAFKKDIEKLGELETLIQDEANKYGSPCTTEKWVVMITGKDEGTLNQLNKSLEDEKQCWIISPNPNKFFLAVLIDVNTTPPSNCQKANKESLESLKKINPMSREKPRGDRPLWSVTQNKDDRKQFLDFVLKDAAKFNVAIKQGKQWETYAQVLLSTRLGNRRVDPERQIREVDYGNGQHKRADLFFCNGDAKYVVELKVSVGGKANSIEDEGTRRNVQRLDDMLKKDLDKLTKWEKGGRRWVVAIMKNDEANCKVLLNWIKAMLEDDNHKVSRRGRSENSCKNVMNDNIYKGKWELRKSNGSRRGGRSSKTKTAFMCQIEIAIKDDVVAFLVELTEEDRSSGSSSSSSSSSIPNTRAQKRKLDQGSDDSNRKRRSN